MRCAVATTAVGRITIRTFDRAGTGALELTTVNVTLTARAGDRTHRFEDVGGDLLRREPDGTLVLSVMGQLPFSTTGVFTVDLDTGEAIHEPRSTTDEDLEEVCAVPDP